MEHILANWKGSQLYRLNPLSQWRQDVKPESWAENNPLVKAVLSIYLWKKSSLNTPRLPTPCTWAFKHTYAFCTDTHLRTYPGMFYLNLTSMHWCPPTLPFCPFCERDRNCGVCLLHFAEMCVLAHHGSCRLNACLCVCLRPPAFAILSQMPACATYAADTLRHLGHSLRRLGNGWSGNTHLASSLWKDGEEEGECERKKVGQSRGHKEQRKMIWWKEKRQEKIKAERQRQVTGKYIKEQSKRGKQAKR